MTSPRRSRLLASTFTAALLALLGCSSGESGSTSTSTTGSSSTAGAGGAGTTSGAGGGATTGTGGSTTGSGGSMVIGGDRPVTMHVSPKYDPSKPAPLLILLHGYGATGTIQEDLYFHLKKVTDERGYVYAVADGTKDATGKQFWNATDACCGFGSTVDDSGYLSSVIDQIKAQYTIDPKRVYFVGHSNGGFMSYRMACDHADQIAAIVSLAGATFSDDSKCKPTEPVAVAEIHGDMDETIAYGGSNVVGFTFPGAVKTTELWAAHDGCDLTTEAGAPKDLDSGLAGAETSVAIYGKGCKPGGHVELWTIAGGKHIPNVTDDFRTSVIDFLDAHPKP
ncbi:MAG: prolyl oligopeptidase family serine peptidase [Byssovorax sp.]